MEEKRSVICRRCGRKLKNPEAIERGMGMICWEKSHREPKLKPLFGETTKKEKQDDTERNQDEKEKKSQND